MRIAIIDPNITDEIAREQATVLIEPATEAITESYTLNKKGVIHASSVYTQEQIIVDGFTDVIEVYTNHQYHIQRYEWPDTTPSEVSDIYTLHAAKDWVSNGRALFCLTYAKVYIDSITHVLTLYVSPYFLVKAETEGAFIMLSCREVHHAIHHH